MVTRHIQPVPWRENLCHRMRKANIIPMLEQKKSEGNFPTQTHLTQLVPGETFRKAHEGQI